MDAKRDRLQKKLDDLLTQASAVATELQGIEQGGAGRLTTISSSCPRMRWASG